MKKIGNLHHDKNHVNTPEFPSEDLGFMLWKAELSKELLSFWKSMKK